MKPTARQYAEALHVITQNQNAEETEKILAGFLARLRREKGMKKLPAIIRALGRLEEERSGVTRVRAIVARDWAGEQKIISEAAEKIFGSEKVKVGIAVKSDVLGGLLLRVENAVWDGTVRTRLNRLKQSLTEG